MRADSTPAILLLGAVRVVRGGQVVDVGRPRQRAVLAVLAARVGRTVPNDELIRSVWGPDAPRSALGNLHTYVSALRKVLEPGGAADASVVLGGDQRGYRLRLPEDNVDAVVFERFVTRAREAAARGDADGCLADLRRAAGLWGGTPLVGVSGPHADAERDRLTASWTAARRAGVRALVARGRDREAVVECTALVREHPLDEDLVELLCRALHGCGRIAEALEELGALRRRLRAELGVAPGPAIGELQRDLLCDGGAGVGAGEPTAVPAPPARPSPAHLPHRDWGFTGRRAELARLHTAASPGATILLTGLTGVGKSALALEFAHEVAHRHPDGQLRVDLGGYPPDRPPATVADVFDRLLRHLGVPRDELPDRVGDKARVLDAALSGRRVLVLLDNASSPAQVRELLGVRADAGLVLVTGPSPGGAPGPVDGPDGPPGVHPREPAEEGSGPHRVHLRELAEQDSVALLTGGHGGPPDARLRAAAAEVARSCGHLPAALRLALAHLTRDADRPPGEAELRALAEDLADESGRLDVLSFDDEPAGLRERLTRVLAGLSGDASALLRSLREGGPVAGEDGAAADELVAFSLAHRDEAGVLAVTPPVLALCAGVSR